MNTQFDDTSDTGFGLVEVLVAMALLMVVALSMLPVIIGALRASATNISVATASQIASDQMDYARTLPATCLALQNFADYPHGNLLSDPRDITLRIERQSGTCPATFPGTISLTANVVLDSTGQVLATSETLVYVTAAS